MGGPLLRHPLSACPCRHHPPPTDAARWCISPKGPLPRLLISSRLRHIRPSLPRAPRWCVSQEGPCHAHLHRHAHAAFGRLLPAPQLVYLPQRPLPRFTTPACPRRLCMSLTGSSSWCISRKSSCLAFLYWHANVTSVRLLPTQLVGASPRRGPCNASSYRVPTPHPVLSSPRIQGVHLLEEAPASPFSNGTSALPLTVSYRRT